MGFPGMLSSDDGVQSMNNDEPLAYFITWTVYGTWLQGDVRGWRRHRVDTKFHNRCLLSGDVTGYFTRSLFCHTLIVRSSPMRSRSIVGVADGNSGKPTHERTTFMSW